MYEKAEIQFNARTHPCKTVIVSKQIAGTDYNGIFKKKKKNSKVSSANMRVFKVPLPHCWNSNKIIKRPVE